MNDYIRKVIKKRKYKAGYEIRTELVDGSQFGCDDYTMKSAYTHNGDYIGDPKMAYMLCKKMGIKPELIGPDSRVCSIGFCEKDQKYYGYSHRAIYGFGIGSKVKKGDCGYKSPNIIEIYAALSKQERENIIDADADGITIQEPYYIYETRLNGSCKRTGEVEIRNYTIHTGQGEWTAKTLEDAKQMAIDFARSVS